LKKLNKVIGISLSITLLSSTALYAAPTNTTIVSETDLTSTLPQQDERIVKLPIREGKAITYQQILEKIYANDSSLKKLKEEMDLTQERRNDISDNAKLLLDANTNYSSDPNYMSQDAINFALQIIGNDQTAKSQKISKELAKINWQYQVVKSIDYIQNQEYAIALSKLSLENEKKKLDVLEKQYELGLKTLDDLDKSKQSYEKSQKDLIKAQENLEEEYVALNRQMGVPLDTKYNIVYDNSYEKMKKVDISSYTTTALLENLNIQLSKMSLESAQNNLDFYMTSNEKIETLRLRVSQASRSLADAKNSLQDKIRKTYTKVEQQETTYANAVKDLETAKNNYDIAQVKFNVGVISQMELEEYKLAIAKAEVAVESAIRSYNEFKMQFMDTNLL
jgi:hypothetical protein